MVHPLSAIVGPVSSRVGIFGAAGGVQFGSIQGASFAVALRALRLDPPVRFLAGPSGSGGGDCDAGLECSGTGGAGEGAGAGVKLKDPWGTDEVAGFEAELEEPWGADGFAGFDAKPKDD